VVLLASFVVFYLLGSIDYTRLIQACIGCAIWLPMSYVGYKMMVNPPPLGSDRMKKRMRIAYPLGGAWLGCAVAFLLVLVSAVFARVLLRYFLTDTYFLFTFLVAPAIGCVWGYWMGKRNGFNKPKWAVWIDEKAGFT
jgi:hypothetical protein